MVKFFILSSYFVFSFLFNHPVYLLILFLNLVLLSIFSKRFKESMNSLRLFIIMVIILIILYTLLNKQGNNIIVYVSDVPLLSTFVITWNALVLSFITSFQLLIVIYSFILFNLLIDTDQLMQVLIKLRLPYTLVLLITLTLRFFPLLQKDLEIITDVQKSRGYELDRGGSFRKIKRKMILLLPLLANSLERSIQVSEALETRAFTRENKRTFYTKLAVNGWDYMNLGVTIGLLTGLIFIKSMGFGIFQILPNLSLPTVILYDMVIVISILGIGIIQILLLRGGNKN